MTGESYLNTLFAVYAFLWGAVWGSFLNVVIWRLPLGMSLSKPPSHCPHCKTPIRWHDNVPILGWILLRGKCRDCGAAISPRYPAIELLVALLSMAVWLHVAGDGRLAAEPFQVLLIPFFFHFYFVAILVAITFIDLDHTIIPHELTIAGMVLGLLAGVLLPKTGVWVEYFPPIDVVTNVIGLVAGFGLIVGIFYGYAFVTGRVGLGGGDATMLGMIGANLGWQSLLFVLFASAVQGLVFAAGLLLFERLSGRETGGDGSMFLKGMHDPDNWDEDPAERAARERADDGGESSEDDAPTASESTQTEDSPTGDSPSTSEDTPNDSGDAEPDEEFEDEGFGKLALPFGPFLALAAIEYFFIGEPIARWFTAGVWP